MTHSREQNSGWIEHDSGAIPVPHWAIVDVIHSRGRTVRGREAQCFEWRPEYSSDPVKAYRLHTPSPSSQGEEQ